MVLLRRLSNELILSLTTTSGHLLKRAIGEQRGLCLMLLAWIDRDPLRHNLARLVIDEALEDGTRGLTGETLRVASGTSRARGRRAVAPGHRHRPVVVECFWLFCSGHRQVLVPPDKRSTGEPERARPKHQSQS